MKANKKIILLFLVIFGFVLFLLTIYSYIYALNNNKSEIQIPSDSVTKLQENEEYSEKIARISNLKEFKEKIKIEIKEKKLSGIEIPILVDDYVRKKFYHKNYIINWYDNWFLSLLDFIIPQYRVNSPLGPNEIIKKDYAICNQQSIIFQEVIKDYGFDYGSVRFTIPNLSHFANAVKIDNNWYYFDTHKEPNYERENPNIFKKIIEGDMEVLQMMYGEKLDFGTNIADIKEGMIELSDINNFPAKRGLLIQKVSFFISWYGWIFFIFLGSLILIFSRKRNL